MNCRDLSATIHRSPGSVFRFVLIMACTLALAPRAMGSVRRYPIDQAEVDKMKIEHPHVAALLEQGEAIASRGEFEQADVLFRQGLDEFQYSSILQRRHCQVLTVLGRRAEATTACYRALEGARSNANVRASVRAWVSGPVSPTMSELGMGLDLASKALDRAPGQYTPIAALCVIAASLGDGIMLRYCTRELNHLAPGAPETQRFEALLSTRCPPVQFWAGWITIAAAVLTTLGHALFRALRRRAQPAAGSAAVAGGLLCAALSMLAPPASAGVASEQEAAPRTGMLSKWPVDDDNPEKNIPNEKERNQDPLEFGYWLQDVIMRAEVYSKHGKHDVAARLYLALAKAMPDRAVSFRKLCEEYEAMGDSEKAIAACGAALLRDGLMVNDYERYVHLVLARPGPLDDPHTKALTNVLAHMKEDAAGREVVDELECQVGVRTSNAAQLETCTANLAAKAPHDAKTIAFQWSLAVLRSKYDNAQQLLEEGRAAGIQPEAIERMQQAMAQGQAGRSRRRLLIGLAAALLLGGAGLLGFTALKRRASASAATSA